MESVRRVGYGAVSGLDREDGVVIGISLLTLVPGVVGGSETYARELCRGLARVGELDYRVFVPTIAEDAGVTPEVAGRWIYEARKPERGFLPPTSPGRVSA